MTAAGQIDLNLKSLRVVLDGEDVGTLASTLEGPLAFQYTRSWLQNGYSISPLSLPLRDEVFVAKKDPLEGVFGVFSDSLPMVGAACLWTECSGKTAWIQCA